MTGAGKRTERSGLLRRLLSPVKRGGGGAASGRPDAINLLALMKG